MSQLRLVGLALVLIACGPSASDNDGGGNGDGGICGNCTVDQVCDPNLGCVDCFPDQTYCNGPNDDEIWMCNSDGSGGTLVSTCAANEVCAGGFCLTPCEYANTIPSNVGCEFWGVDLDNEAYMDPIFMVPQDAAAQQFAIAVANVNIFPVQVEVFKNTARVGQPVVEERVVMVTVQPSDLQQINLPQREVDGTMGQNGAYSMDTSDLTHSGTFVSPHAYRVVSNGPIVAYQFNPIIQAFSNDASILIPQQALGRDYYVLGYATSNPCRVVIPGLSFDSVPDHGAVTIMANQPNTTVTVVATQPIMASGGDTGFDIAQTPAGGTLAFTMDTYDVVNLESDQPLTCAGTIPTGDFSGTHVTSDKPIAVFVGGERVAAGGETGEPGGGCCTEHIEQQMFPTTALGWDFAISRSAIRSTVPGDLEPDVYRVLATTNNTPITTNLPPPFDSFLLDAGEFATFWTDTGFTISSQGGAIMIGQYLIAQEYLPGERIGDTSLVIFPAADQHRKDYIFLIPTTFTRDYMALSVPDGALITVDGLPRGEFDTNCDTGAIGMVNGKNYTQITCLMPDGVHTVQASEPVGLTVYGYYTAGSYAYPGGSDVKIINPVE